MNRNAQVTLGGCSEGNAVAPQARVESRERRRGFLRVRIHLRCSTLGGTLHSGQRTANPVHTCIGVRETSLCRSQGGMRAGFAQFTAFSQDAKGQQNIWTDEAADWFRLIVQLLRNEVLVLLLGHVGTLGWFGTW